MDTVDTSGTGSTAQTGVDSGLDTATTTSLPTKPTPITSDSSTTGTSESAESEEAVAEIALEDRPGRSFKWPHVLVVFAGFAVLAGAAVLIVSALREKRSAWYVPATGVLQQCFMLIAAALTYAAARLELTLWRSQAVELTNISCHIARSARFVRSLTCRTGKIYGVG